MASTAVASTSVLSPRSRKLAIRAMVAGALVMFFAAVAGIVVAGPVHHPLAPQDVRFIHARLVAFDQGVRTQLVRVRPHRQGIVRAQRETRQAIEGINSLGRAVDGAGGTTAELLRVAVINEVRFLDAAGSVLSNPRSPLLNDLPALDVAARRSLDAIDGPRARRKGGVRALQRLRRDSAPAPTPA
ncbi:MAG TPA: hypothetical protein VL120_06560 [Solirubrobacteraceae bacterium]|jgi:hypothetical protein|nr:hypothetical protein [Solirubrobacteraceae bacterium]